MSLISIDQFDEFSEAYPELAECYDIRYDSDTKDADDDEEEYDPTTDPEDEYFRALRLMEVL